MEFSAASATADVAQSKKTVAALFHCIGMERLRK
jgi:hypothetical protein